MWKKISKNVWKLERDSHVKRLGQQEDHILNLFLLIAHALSQLSKNVLLQVYSITRGHKKYDVKRDA